MANESPQPDAGEPSSARQWLLDFGWTLPDPTERDLVDLDRVMKHDEFWEWSSGKIDMEPAGNTTWLQTCRDIGIVLLTFAVAAAIMQLVAWWKNG